MAAGRGVRLMPITDIVPKAMVPYNGSTLIAIGIDKIRLSVFLLAVFVIGCGKPDKRPYADKGVAEQPVPQRLIVVTVDDLPGGEPGTDHATGDLKELQRVNHTIPGIFKARHAE